MSKLFPIHLAPAAGKSISDDDLCATCDNCSYNPGEESTCSLGNTSAGVQGASH